MIAAKEKIRTSRSANAVWLKNGVCPAPHLHFQGCTRAVFKYMEYIRQQQHHGGFVFMRIKKIRAKTKNWKTGKQYSIPQIKRAIKILRELCVLGKYETRMIKRRRVRGWQMSGHKWWAETHDGACDLKCWLAFEVNQQVLMGNKPLKKQQNDTDYDTANDTVDDTAKMSKRYRPEYRNLN